MTIIYVTENNCKCYGVTFQNNGYVRVQKFGDVSSNENFIFCLKPLQTFLGKSKVCDLTLMSGAFDKSVFDGSTFLLEIREDFGRHRF